MALSNASDHTLDAMRSAGIVSATPPWASGLNSVTTGHHTISTGAYVPSSSVVRSGAALEIYATPSGVDWGKYGQHMYLTYAKDWDPVVIELEGKTTFVYRHPTISPHGRVMEEAMAMQCAMDAVNI